MQLDEFLDALSSVKDDYDWAITGILFANVPVYLIRGRNQTGSYVCPTIAVCEKLTGVLHSGMDHAKAGSDIGLDNNLARSIMRAGDTLMNWDSALRNQLLERLGLEEDIGCLGYYASSKRPLAAR